MRRAATRWRRIGLLVAVLLAAVLVLFETDRSRAGTRARWASPPSTFVVVDGMEVHLRREGSGPALVLLHGTGASLHTWDGWVRELADDFELVRFDLPAFGLTGPHPQRAYAIADYVDFVVAVLDRLGLDRVHLAGNSLGGHIAWRLAARHPMRVERLVLVSPGGHPDGLGSALAVRLARLPLLAGVVRWADPSLLVAHSLRDVYGDPDKVDAELVERYVAMALAAGNRQAFVDRARTPAEPARLFDDLGEVRSPTLLLWGGSDRWIPPAQADAFVDRLEDARLIVYPALGHVPMEEAPVLTAADARAFLMDAD